MIFVGIDVGSEHHTTAIVDKHGELDLNRGPFLRTLTGIAGFETCFAIQPTVWSPWRLGHYWRNLFASLTADGFAIALLNPIPKRRFAGEELQRTKTDHVDALGIACFAVQKRSKPTRLPD